MSSILETLKQAGLQRRLFQSPERVIQNIKDIHLLANRTGQAFFLIGREIPFEKIGPLTKKVFRCLRGLRETIDLDALSVFASTVKELKIKTPAEEGLCPGDIFVLLEYTHPEQPVSASLAEVKEVSPNFELEISAISLARINPLQTRLETASYEETEISDSVLYLNERVVLPVSNLRFKRATSPQAAKASLQSISLAA